MSLLDRDLPEPSFVDRDPAPIVAEIVAWFEAETGRTLYPAQVERLYTNIVAYRETLIREAIQDAAKQNLLRYASGVVLEMMGELVGVSKLAGAPAGCMQTFTFDASPLARTLPAGTLVQAGDVEFSTIADVVVPAGATTASVAVLCTTIGVSGNGFVAGQVNTLSASIPSFSGVSTSNITATGDGYEDEQEEQLRERIALAPEGFSTAGSVGAYQFWARSAWAGIKDVAVVHPEMAVQDGDLVSVNGVPPGQVRIYVLMRDGDGTPGQPVLDAVLTSCSGEKVRPVCDQVQVLPREAVHTNLVVELTVYAGSDLATTLQYGQQAAADYQTRVKAKMGVDIVRSQIDKALHVAGVYKVSVIQPAADLVLQPQQWIVFDQVQITIAGVANG